LIDGHDIVLYFFGQIQMAPHDMFNIMKTAVMVSIVVMDFRIAILMAIVMMFFYIFMVMMAFMMTCITLEMILILFVITLFKNMPMFPMYMPMGMTMTVNALLFHAIDRNGHMGSGDTTFYIFFSPYMHSRYPQGVHMFQ